jgi:soluble lytic murein transglycosylase-like protein
VADSFALPPSLLAAIIQEESRFEPWAARTEPHYKRKAIVQQQARVWSKRFRGLPTYETELDDRSRSIGLMQVMGQLAREQGFTSRYLSELHLPEHAVHHGAKRLRLLLDRYRGDTLSAVSAYNQGNNRMRGETFANARYVYRVCAAWRIYRRWLR